MIRFRCSKCNKVIRAPESCAGKKGRCPRCKSAVSVPQLEPQAASFDAAESSSGNPDITSALSQLPRARTPPEESAADFCQADRTAHELYELEQQLATNQGEPVPERRLPCFIDIFLYPTSKSGLTIIAIIVLIPLLIDLAAMALGTFGFLVAIPAIVIKIVIGLYTYWYICECIRDSTQGGIRAPDITADPPGLGEMAGRTFTITGCLVIVFSPPLLYWLYTRNTDNTLWILAAISIFFYPMGLLAVIVFDSLSALNPVLLIGSIVSTFLPYLGLVMLLAVMASLLVAIGIVSALPLVGHLAGLVMIYIALVGAHLLGRFFFRYQEKLYWDA